MSFNVSADSYLRFMGRYSEPLAAQFADLAGVRDGQRLLDVGCGPGALTAELVSQAGPEAVSAVEPSGSFAAAARERLPGVDIRQAGAERLPFGDAAFDAALAQLVVHFMADPVAGLREMGRVTRPGGVVAACVWDHAGGRGPLSAFWRAVRELDPGADDESNLAGVREGHLAELFAQAGLGAAQVTTLTVRVRQPGFESWWETFTLGVGPAGAYLTSLPADRRDELRERCRRQLPVGPFEVSATAWAATARKKLEASPPGPDSRSTAFPMVVLLHTAVMSTSTPRRSGGRTLIDLDPGQLKWILLARESTLRDKQLGHQLTDLRDRVASIGGTVDREIPENAVSAFKRQRVQLPDGTFGFRVVRPEWEKILTALRRGECNALMVPDIDRATRDPRTLEDLIDAVELYGLYVASLTGNIDLTTDAGISAARGLVNQRNQESRNTARRVIDGQRHAAMKGGNHGGKNRPFGWRKDRVHLSKREAEHIRREITRILAGVRPITLAREWNERGIPTVNGSQWHAATIKNIFTGPRIAGYVVYRGEILYGPDGMPVRGQWEPILTEEEYAAVTAKWKPTSRIPSRLGAVGRGMGTYYLLSPFLRCGKCNSRMLGGRRNTKNGPVEFYRCPAKGQGGCGSLSRLAAPVNEYIKALVIAEQQKIEFRKLEDLPPWPKAQELADLQARIDESTRRYEKGQLSSERYWPSLARMEADEAELKRRRRQYKGQQQRRMRAVANLAEEWDKPDFAMEQKQAAIGATLTAVIIKPVGRGIPFHPDHIVPVFQESDAEE